MSQFRGGRWSALAYGAVRLYAAGRNRSRRLGQRVDTAFGDLLFSVTTEPEKDLITRACYATTSHTQGDGRQTLFDWERAWYQRALPPPPARILVAGAGWGREMRALRTLGYSVFGFDPIEPPADSVPEGIHLVQGDYRAFVDVVAGVTESPALEPVCAQPYDAVILGWGSLAHVLSPDLRLRVFDAAAALAPSGPILASVWCRPAEEVPPRSAIRRRFMALGQALGRIRGLTPEPATDFSFSPSHGFGVYLSEAQLASTAAALGRPMTLERHPFPHVVFAANSASG